MVRCCDGVPSYCRTVVPHSLCLWAQPASLDAAALARYCTAPPVPQPLRHSPVPLQGPYNTRAGFEALHERLTELEAAKPQAHRMFFLSIPPDVFTAAAGNAADCASSRCD